MTEIVNQSVMPKMMVIRKKFPRVYTYPRNGKPYYMVSLRSKPWGLTGRKFFLLEKEAVEFARKFEAELMEKGKTKMGENLVVTDSKISALVERLNAYGETLENAVNHYLKVLGDRVTTQLIPTVNELVQRWKKEKLDSKINPISERTKTEVKSYSAWIARTFGQLRPREVTYNLCLEKVNGLKVGNVSRKQYSSYLRNFFKWCKKHKFITENPTDDISVTIEDKEIEIYEPEQIKTILDLAQTKQFQPLLGFYILGTFLGLRPTEAERVEWKDINFKTKEIYVRKGKTPARRFRMNDTAILWLQHFKTISPNQLNPKKAHANLQRSFRDKLTVWIPDGLRHSYGTFHWNQCRNINETVFTMGNSVTIAKKHYCREIEGEKVTAFWSITP